MEWEGVGYHISCYRKGLRFGRSIEISHLMLQEGPHDWNGNELDITSHVIGSDSGLVLEALRYQISSVRKGLKFGI